MKRAILTIIVFFILISMTMAQTVLEMIRKDLRAQRQEIIAEILELTPAEAEAFWPLYREYEVEQAGLMDARIADIKKYAEKYMVLTDEESRQLLKEFSQHNRNLAKLDKKYGKKFLKVIPPQQVVRFFQANQQINHYLLLQISSALPFVEKMDVLEK
ncbi:hypothetical protein EH222_12395 [candidate division KSB1 bacterium]|nr:MAG: hypothetical protein EH222_12395 [candidate division KSB1 bacterium]